MAAALLDDSPKKHKKIETMMDEVDDIKRGPDHEFISKLITEHFSQKIFDIVCDFMVKKNSEELVDAVSDVEDEEEDAGEYGYED